MPSGSSNWNPYRTTPGTELQLHPDGKNGPDTNSPLKKVTLGDHIGAGKYGDVFNVQDHELGDHPGGLVAKVFSGVYDPPTSGKSKDSTQTELDNLRTVDKLRASGTAGNQRWAVMDKVDGKNFQDTPAYAAAKAADTHAASQAGTALHDEKTALQDPNTARGQVRAGVDALKGDAQMELANNHGIIHDDAHAGNFLVNDAATQGSFVDFGRTLPVNKPAGGWTPEQEAAIRNHVSSAKHGLNSNLASPDSEVKFTPPQQYGGGTRTEELRNSVAQMF